MIDAENKGPQQQPKPLPNTGIIPHPQDIVIILNQMNEAGLAAGYLRVRAVDGNVETNGFTFLDDKIWALIEKENPAVAKLARMVFVIEKRAEHARRELLNAQEAITRGMEVLSGKRPVVL